MKENLLLLRDLLEPQGSNKHMTAISKNIYFDVLDDILHKYNIKVIHKDIFACLFSIHNIISLSCHEQVCLSGLILFDNHHILDHSQF